MTANKGFLLSAGFGTRFKPQSLFLPKPALPFLNLPQALFPAAALKSVGVNEFFYNSHHLSTELDSKLKPYFKRNSIFENEILDSAGGIANAKSFLKTEENFWVANGDSLVFLNDPEVLSEAMDFHQKNNAAATLIGIEVENKNTGGLAFDKNHQFLGISKSAASLHFIGFYIFNKEIWNHFKTGAHHIFRDVLLKEVQSSTFVFNAEKRISWYETGNEADFLKATQKRLLDLAELKLNSTTFSALKHWNSDYIQHTKSCFEDHLEHFLKYKIWGNQDCKKAQVKDFLCISPTSSGDFSNLDNSIVGPDLYFESRKVYQNKVLIHPSQWT